MTSIGMAIALSCLIICVTLNDKHTSPNDHIRVGLNLLKHLWLIQRMGIVTRCEVKTDLLGNKGRDYLKYGVAKLGLVTKMGRYGLFSIGVS